LNAASTPLIIVYSILAESILMPIELTKLAAPNPASDIISFPKLAVDYSKLFLILSA